MTRYTIQLDVRRDIPLTVWECEDLFSTAAHAAGGIYRWGTWSRRGHHAIGRTEQHVYSVFRITIRVRCEALPDALTCAQTILAALDSHSLGVETRLFDVDTTLPRRL